MAGVQLDFSAAQVNSGISKALVRNFALIQDIKANNTSGQGIAAGAWRTRQFTTESYDPAGRVSLASNQITIQAGDYRVVAECPGYFLGSHQCQLYNVTGAIEYLGSSEWCSNLANAPQTWARVIAYFTLTSAKVFELQHWSELTNTPTVVVLPATLAGT